jgi:hypothetical protein
MSAFLRGRRYHVAAYDVVCCVAQMFGKGPPPIEWDPQGEYSRDRVALFYCSNAGTVMRKEQIVEALQGLYPTGYVETGCQVLPAPPVCRCTVATLQASSAAPLCSAGGCATTRTCTTTDRAEC